jgi:hypothetical protein
MGIFDALNPSEKKEEEKKERAILTLVSGRMER